ncbi:MAG: hypothetical protein LWX70_00035 [Sphingobacteriia bacterium]|nr:hypothetical protein [Sphingobacteriia bacterium]
MGYKRLVYKPLRHKAPVKIQLPLSKSVVNRLLILQWLSNETLLPEQPNEALDTTILRNLIAQADSDLPEPILNAGLAGTTSRFILAALALKRRKCLVTGDARLIERPITPLIASLNHIGANLRDTAGRLPVRISGSTSLMGGEVLVDGSLSSQFITALLLIAPFLEEGLLVRWETRPVSYSYIQTTLLLLGSLGGRYEESNDSIYVYPGKLSFEGYRAPLDWSSVTGWYNLVACGLADTLFFPGLSMTGFQPDEAVVDLYKRLGVVTSFTDEGALIRVIEENEVEPDDCFSTSFPESLDCSSFPDLVPTLAVTLAIKGIHCRLFGLSTLRVKESDRIASLSNELIRVGVMTNEGSDYLALQGGTIKSGSKLISFDTYNDHRMAIALTPFVLYFGEIEIENPEVVNKSYPGWWSDLKEMGIDIES